MKTLRIYNVKSKCQNVIQLKEKKLNIEKKK